MGKRRSIHGGPWCNEPSSIVIFPETYTELNTYRKMGLFRKRRVNMQRPISAKRHGWEGNFTSIHANNYIYDERNVVKSF